jgi:hypothetical protein
MTDDRNLANHFLPLDQPLAPVIPSEARNLFSFTLATFRFCKRNKGGKLRRPLWRRLLFCIARIERDAFCLRFVTPTRT